MKTKDSSLFENECGLACDGWCKLVFQKRFGEKKFILNKRFRFFVAVVVVVVAQQYGKLRLNTLWISFNFCKEF